MVADDWSSLHGEDAEVNHHGDCLHHLDPLVRDNLVSGLGYVAVAVAASYATSHPQHDLGSDPPPPRVPS